MVAMMFPSAGFTSLPSKLSQPHFGHQAALVSIRAAGVSGLGEL
jgi:hypothetical protein